MIVGSLEIQLMAGIARLQRDMNAGRQVVSNATASMERAANAARTALASIGAGLIGGAGLSQLIRMTDEYTKFTAQLKLATTSQSAYAQALADVKRISTTAQNDIAATGVLYARIANGTRELGISQGHVARITETVNLALAATGATSSEASSAMLQLSQAFASGVLRGEEFNSVNEAAPALMKALAAGLGIPVGALRKMAEEGKITSAVMAKVFGDSQLINDLRGSVAQITTFSGALTVFKNNLMEVVGTQAHASGAVQALTSAILGAAGSINTLIDILTTAAKIAAAYFALFVVAPPVITATAAAMTRLGHALAVYAMNVAIGQANTIKFNTALFGTTLQADLAAGAVSRLGLALNSIFLLYAGWQIGKYLNDQFVEVQIAGEIMAGGLLEGWERIKFGGKVAFDGLTVLARESVSTLANLMADWFNFVSKGLRAIGDDTKADAIDAYAEKMRNATAVSGTFASRTAEARAEMEKNIKVIDQDTERRITAAVVQANLVEGVDRSAEAAAKAAAAAAEATAEEKRQAAAFRDLTRALQDRVDVTAREVAGLAPLTEAEKAHLNLTRQIADGKLKLSKAQEANTRSLIDEAGANDVLAKSNAEWKKLQDDMAAAAKDLAAERYSLIESAKQEAEQNEWRVKTFGMTEAAIIRMGAARLLEQEAQRLGRPLTEEEIADLQRVIELKERSAAAVERRGVLEAGTDVTKAKELLDIMVALDDAAKSAAQNMEESFGRVGSAIGGLTVAMSGYSRAQAGIAAQLAAATKDAGGDQTKILKANQVAAAQSSQAQVRSYGDMAGAAKDFFKENTAGYKVMQGAEKAFRAAEMAMALEAMLTKSGITAAFTSMFVASKATEVAAETTKTGVSTGLAATEASAWGITAVVKALASLPFPANIAAGAATLAAVVAIGAKVLGGLGGGGGVSLTEQRQATQGTGTVLGSDAKSESIARSLDAIEGATFQGLGISNGMLTSLRNIEAGIVQFASLLVRTTGVTGDFGSGQSGSASSLGGKAVQSFDLVMAGGLLTTLDKLVGGVLGSVTNAIFGGRKTVEDTGFTIDPISFQGIQNGALSSMQYADIKKDGGLFGKDKNSTLLEGLGEEGNRQIASVLMSLYDTVLEAGTMLGLGADGFAAQLNSFVVDIGMVSLKGLSDDEIEKELSAVFSKVGDQLASFGVGGLAQFQKVGEGYLETLTRVATNYQAVTVVTDSLGMTFSAMGLASVGARERLIDLVGGLDEFTSSADQFLTDFYSDKERADALRGRITPTLDQFGIKTGTEDALEQFRSVVTGLDLTTEAGARAYATLIQIAPAFKQIADVDAAIFEERAELQDELDQLTMSAAQLLAKQRDALDESNRALFDQIQAIKAQTDATQAAKDAAASLLGGVDSAFSVLQKVVNRQKQALQDEIGIRAKSVQSIEALSQSLRSTLDGMTVQGREAEDRQAAQAQIQAALAIAKASGKLPSAEDLRSALSVVSKDASSQFATQTEYLRDFYSTRAGIEDLAGLTDDALSVEERSLKRLEDQVKQYDLMLEKYQEEIDVLKGISTIGLSIEQAILALQGAMLAAKANPVNAATSAISDAYKSSLGRAPDAAGLEYWQGQAAGGISTGAIVDTIKNSPEAQIQKLYQDVFGRTADAAGMNYWIERLNGGISLDAIEQTFVDSDEKKARVPGYANGGDFAGGWRIVGENGPELEATGPARIFNASQTQGMMRRLTSPADNSTALAAAVDRLNATVDRQATIIAQQSAALDQIQRNTRRVADTQDIVTEGGKAMRTKEQQVTA